MASLYQDFIINIIEKIPTKRHISIKAIWFSNVGGSKIAQISEISIDGGLWLPMISNAATQYTYITPNLIPAGLGQSYNIRIREDSDRVFDLGDFFISSIGNECPNLAGDGEGYFVYPSTRLADDGSDRPLLIQSGQSGSFSINSHSIDGGVNFKATDINGTTNWTNLEVSAVPSPLQIVINTVGNDSLLCPKSHVSNLDWPPTGIQLSETHTNPTTNGGSDGSILIDVLNGSGNFTFLWNDANTNNPRTGLISGNYSVVVVDTTTAEIVSLNNIILTEPAEAVSTFPNTLIISSPINPIRFKENKSGNDLPLENYNFCEQPTENMVKPYTPEIFNVQDQTTLQFISDYSANNIKKTNIDTGAVENIPLTLVQDNLSGGQINNITISDNGIFAGSSTVRLNRENQPSYPDPVIGDLVLLSLSTSYNGSYAIVDISQNGLYVVINTPFTIEEPAKIKFLSTIRFNVYELPILFVDWGVGNYKLEFETTDGIPNTVIKLISEFISVKPFTPNTILLVYSNNDNAYNVIWNTEIVMRKRHEGFFIKAVPTRDSTNFRNSDDSPEILNAYIRNKEQYNIFDLTWYSVQRLALIYSCDNLFINGKKMFIEEIPETEQSNSRYLLGRQTIIAEQVGWLDNHNTHDIGDTSEESIVIGGDSEEVLGV